jgi:hypothetical protein
MAEQTQPNQDAEILKLLDQAGVSDTFTPVADPIKSPISEISEGIGPSPMEAVGNFLTQYAPELGELGGDLGAARYAMQAMRDPVPPMMKPVTAAARGIAAEVGLPMLGRAVGETVQDYVEGRVDPIDTINKAAETGAFATFGRAAGEILGGAKEAIHKLQIGKKPTEEQLKYLMEVNQALGNSGVTIGDTGVPVHLTPAQLTGSKFLTTLEKIGLAGFGGGGIFDIYKAQDEAIRKIYDQNVTMLDITRRNSDGSVNGLSDYDMGKAFQDSVDQARGEFIAFSEKQWGELDKQAKNVKLNTTGVESYVRNVLQDAGVDLVPNRGLTGSKKDLQNLTTRLGNENLEIFEKTLKGLLDNERSVSFYGAFTDIRNLRDLAYQASKEGNQGLAKSLNNLRAAYEKSLNNQSEKVGTDVWKRFQNLSDMYAKGMEGFNRATIEVGLDAHPEFVGELLFKEGNVTTAKDAMEALKHSAGISSLFGKGLTEDQGKTLKRMQAGYLDSLYGKILASPDEKAIDTAIKEFTKLTTNSKTNRTFATVFSKEDQGKILKGLQYAKQMEKQSAGNFSLAVRGQQTANVRKVLSDQNSALGKTWAAMLAAGPAMIARWMLEEGGEKQVKRLMGLNSKLMMNPNEFNKRDQMALFSVMASAPFRHEELPSDFQEVQADPRDVILMKKLESLGIQ